MAKTEKKEKTLLLRNTICDFICPWINKLDGSNNHRFVKGEIFEVPETVERERNGEKVQVSTLDLLRAAFGNGIEEAKGAISMSAIKEKDEEIAKLKAELAKSKKIKKEPEPESDELEETHEPEESEAVAGEEE